MITIAGVGIVLCGDHFCANVGEYVTCSFQALGEIAGILKLMYQKRVSKLV